MKILIAGGYGVFGGRLARLLIRDGHEVIIAGRNVARAQAFAAKYGGTAMRLDVRGDLASLRRADPDVVVDAAGPFQAYTNELYRLASEAIAIGAHYFDLSDDADFSRGIVALDDKAKAGKVVALSAASSAPAISAAAVRALSTDMDEIELIDIAILPGNRAPRGHSVMQAIMGQAGAPLSLWRNNQWREALNWSRPRKYTLADGSVRSAYLIRVPDVEVLPQAFGARSVLFRAGMELPLMNHALTVLGWLRRQGLFLATPRIVALSRRIADLLRPFGTDRGGMVVSVCGYARGTRVTRRWTLTAEGGDGPFIPATPIRALLTRLDALTPGARVCVDDLTLEALAKAHVDLAITTDIAEVGDDLSVFESALSDEWETLPSAVQAAHRVADLKTLSGEATVTRGAALLPRIAARLFRLPLAGENVPVTVTMERTGNEEIWERDFDGRRFRSRLSRAGAARFREQFGPFTFELVLTVAQGQITMAVDKGWFGPLPLPRGLLPGGDGVEAAQDGRFTFDVSMRAPVTGALIVRYQGWLVDSAT